MIWECSSAYDIVCQRPFIKRIADTFWQESRLAMIYE